MKVSGAEFPTSSMEEVAVVLKTNGIPHFPAAFALVFSPPSSAIFCKAVGDTPSGNGIFCPKISKEKSRFATFRNTLGRILSLKVTFRLKLRLCGSKYFIFRAWDSPIKAPSIQRHRKLVTCSTSEKFIVVLVQQFRCFFLVIFQRH